MREAYQLSKEVHILEISCSGEDPAITDDHCVSYELDLILYAESFLLAGREGVLAVREESDQR